MKDDEDSAYTQTNEALHLVRLVQEQLLEYGVRAVLAGGAVRDMLHGQVPKDFDLVVLGAADADDAYAALEDLERSSKLRLFDHDNAEVMGSLADSERLGWVIKAEIHGVQIDVIKLRYEPETPNDVLQYFDCTLNMAWYDFQRTRIVKSPEYPAWGGLVKLSPYCDPVLPRVTYLQSKYPQYQWPTQAELEVHPNYEGARC